MNTVPPQKNRPSNSNEFLIVILIFAAILLLTAGAVIGGLLYFAHRSRSDAPPSDAARIVSHGEPDSASPRRNAPPDPVSRRERTASPDESKIPSSSSAHPVPESSSPPAPQSAPSPRPAPEPAAETPPDSSLEAEERETPPALPSPPSPEKTPSLPDAATEPGPDEVTAPPPPEPEHYVVSTHLVSAPPPAPSSPRSKWPHRLDPDPPEGVVPPSNEPGWYFGAIELSEDAPFLFAVKFSEETGEHALFHVDSNRDGDLENDTPSFYSGTGRYLRETYIDLPLMLDDLEIPYTVWLWISPPEYGNPPAYDYAPRCFRRGTLHIEMPGLAGEYPVYLIDFSRNGRFDSGKAAVDWNRDREISRDEWLETGSPLVREGYSFLLKEIVFPGTRVRFSIAPVKPPSPETP
jgi:hypothetical protein